MCEKTGCQYRCTTHVTMLWSKNRRRKRKVDMMTPSRDPVCGMVVGGDVGRPASSSALYDGQAYAFCSDVCKHAFLTNPGPTSEVP